jgi:hypothetical protein
MAMLRAINADRACREGQRGQDEQLDATARDDRKAAER